MQRKAFELLNQENYQELYDLCVGKVFSNRIELLEHLGEQVDVNSDLLLGKLDIAQKQYDVDYIGTSSKDDNMWFSAEVEEQLSDENVYEIMKVRKLLNQVGLGRFYKGKINLNENLTGDMLATIYTGFMTSEQAYYVIESNGTSLYMRIKNLPKEIFEKIGPAKFLPRVMEIINTTSVKNHKLMVESFALNNGCPIKVAKNKIAVVFEEGESEFVFDDQNRLININGGFGGKEIEPEDETLEVEEDIIEDITPVDLEEETTENDEESFETEDAENIAEEPVYDDIQSEEVATDYAKPEVLDEVNDVVEDINDVENNLVEEVVSEPVLETPLNIQDFPEDVEEVKAVEEKPVVEETININTDIPDVGEEIPESKEEEKNLFENTRIEEPIVEEEKTEEVEGTEIEEASAPVKQNTKTAGEMAEAVLNCSEQSGLFESLGIEDEETIDSVCAEIAIRILQSDETINSVAECVNNACAKFGFEVDLNTATTFASCYYESYVLQ